MNKNKYKYFDKLHIEEARCAIKGGYLYEWFGDDYQDHNDFWEHEYELNSRYDGWYYNWINDPSRIRNSKIDQILSVGEVGNIFPSIPKSLFK